MTSLKKSALVAISAFIALSYGCAKPAVPNPGVSSAAAPSAEVGSGPAPAGQSLAVPVSTAPRPWYADKLEKLGFYVFPAPVDVGDFTVEALKGGAASLSQARGKAVLLNFWATWCPPCRQEMPSIEALWNKSKNKSFTIFAVSVGEEKATVDKFIAEQKYSYPIFLDPQNKLGSAFNASSIPTTYIIDKNGKVIAGTQGAREYDGPEVMAFFAELASK